MPIICLRIFIVFICCTIAYEIFNLWFLWVQRATGVATGAPVRWSAQVAATWVCSSGLCFCLPHSFYRVAYYFFFFFFCIYVPCSLGLFLFFLNLFTPFSTALTEFFICLLLWFWLSWGVGVFGCNSELSFQFAVFLSRWSGRGRWTNPNAKWVAVPLGVELNFLRL